MSLLGSVSGFAAFGVLVRSYALGLQKRPILSSECQMNSKYFTCIINQFLLLLDPSSHALTAAVFGSAGYFLYNLQERQSALIAAKKEKMIETRARAEELATQ